MPSKKYLLRKFLKGIETGDAMAAAVVKEDKYIQHNPQIADGALAFIPAFTISFGLLEVRLKQFLRAVNGRTTMENFDGGVRALVL